MLRNAKHALVSYPLAATDVEPLESGTGLGQRRNRSVVRLVVTIDIDRHQFRHPLKHRTQCSRRYVDRRAHGESLCVDTIGKSEKHVVADWPLFPVETRHVDTPYRVRIRL
jgi:hypothetical protein